MATSIGMDRRTGRRITDRAHLVQSIEDILTTRVKTRVMRRAYGSDVPKLIDAPMTDQVVLAFYVAVAEALLRWEPRYELTQVTLEAEEPDGRATLRLYGIWRPRAHHGDSTPATDTDLAVTLVEMAEGSWRYVA